MAAELINENMAEKIANTNFSKIDKDSDGFMKLTVNILLRHGKFVLIKHLLDFSSEDDSLNLSQDVINGSRTILGKVLHEINVFCWGTFFNCVDQILPTIEHLPTPLTFVKEFL